MSNLHHRHTDRRSRTISKKKSSSELGNKPEPPWATIQRFVFHDFPFSPIWISNWVFGFFVCFIGKFQILSISFLMRTKGECLFISCIVLMKDAVLGLSELYCLVAVVEAWRKQRWRREGSWGMVWELVFLLHSFSAIRGMVWELWGFSVFWRERFWLFGEGFKLGVFFFFWRGVVWLAGVKHWFYANSGPNVFLIKKGFCFLDM